MTLHLVPAVLGTWVEASDPGAVRRRRGAQAALAAVSTWLSLRLLIGLVAGHLMPQVSLFGVTACFVCAMVVGDPRRSDRALTLVGSAVTLGAAATLAALLAEIADLTPVVLLGLVFLSFAARRRGLRAGELAFVAAMGLYFAGANGVGFELLGWFVVAAAMGVAWLALWQLVLLPYDPARSITSAGRAFSRHSGDLVATCAAILRGASDQANVPALGRELQRRLRQVRLSREVIESQFPGALAPGNWTQERLRLLHVTLYDAELGLGQLADACTEPAALADLPTDLRAALVSALEALSGALRDATAGALETQHRKVADLHDQVRILAQRAIDHGATADTSPAPWVPAAVRLAGGSRHVAQSLVRARALLDVRAGGEPAARPTGNGEPGPIGAELPSGGQPGEPATAGAPSATAAALSSAATGVPSGGQPGEPATAGAPSTTAAALSSAATGLPSGGQPGRSPAPAPPAPAPPAPAPPLRTIGGFRIQPTTALGVQAVIAVAAAMLVGRLSGVDHVNWVFWTAFVVIAGSVGESLRRMLLRVLGTVAGVVVGVGLAVALPDNAEIVVLIATAGVFLTIYWAPISYAVMVFWLNLAFVVVYAQLGARPIDLLVERPLATLLGALVAAVVVVMVLPSRLTVRYRRAVIGLLSAVGDAVGNWTSATGDGSHAAAAAAGARVDGAWKQVERTLESMSFETNPLVGGRSPLTEQGTRLGALSTAVTRLGRAAATAEERAVPGGDVLLAALAQRIRVDLTSLIGVLNGSRGTLDASLVDITGPETSAAVLATLAAGEPAHGTESRSAAEASTDNEPGILSSLVEVHGRVIELARGLGATVESATSATAPASAKGA